MTSPTKTPAEGECVFIPRKFFDDHEERGLPTPKVDARCSRYVHIQSDDPHAPELLSDAEYYSDPKGFPPEYRGLCMSARRTAEKLRAVGVGLARR